jgi:hypothetical protein
LYFLEGVDAVIGDPSDLEDGGVGTVSDLAEDLKVHYRHLLFLFMMYLGK